MAYLENIIGGFDFITLDGRVDPPAQTVVIDSRPGVLGMEFTFLGKKAKPFTLISTRDVDDLTQADVFVAAYKALIGDNTVSITQNGVQILVGQYLIKVLDVTPLTVQKISTAVGNKRSNQAGVLLTCRWDLIAVPF